MRTRSRDEDLFDIGAKFLAVDRAVEDERGGDAVVAQGGDERRGFPVAERHMRDETLALLAAAIARRHVGRSPSLIDEHQPARVEALLRFAPSLAGGRYVGSFLLGCAQSFFIRQLPTLNEAADRRGSDLDPSPGQLLPQLGDRKVGTGANEGANRVFVLSQDRALRAAEFLRPAMPQRRKPLHQLNDAARADPENPRHLMTRAPRQNRPDDPLAQVSRKSLPHPC
jgi:hypothetical protein